MSKLVAILALYAAGLATWMLLDRDRQPATRGPSVADVAAAAEAGTQDERRIMFEARRMMRGEIKDIVRNVDWRLTELEAIRKAMDAGLEATLQAAESAAQGSYSKLEEMTAQLGRLGELSGRLKESKEALEGLEKRIASLEARPPQVIREMVSGPAPVNPTEPQRPQLPTVPGKDPVVVAREVAEARKDIQSEDLDVLFPAIEKVREHRVLDAVPRLLDILASYADPFGRTAAAAALGKMEIAAAVPGLTEALVDKSGLVAQQANKAIRQITEYDTQISATARIRERRTARNRFKEWWGLHEDEVRARLGQPKAADPVAPSK